VKQVFVDGRRFEIKEEKKESAQPGVAGKWKGFIAGKDTILTFIGKAEFKAERMPEKTAGGGDQ